MRRRWIVFAFLAAALVALLLLRKAHQPAAADAPAASLTPKKPRVFSQRAVPQRGPVSVAPQSSPAAAAVAPMGAFEGRVVSSLTGVGLPQAQLTFARDEETSAVSADGEGNFRFEPRARGRWFLAAATAKGFLPFAPEWGESPVQLEARPGEVVRGITVALDPAALYEGHVLDQGGKPVAGAAVSLLGGESAVVPLTTRYVTDSSGAFSFSAPDGAVLEARSAVSGVGRAVVDLAVRMSKKLTIRLTPREAAPAFIEGVALDERGQPVEGAAISAQEKLAFAQPPVLARTDGQGRFRLDSLAKAVWMVTATHRGLAPATAEVAAPGNVQLRLVRGGALEGRVTDKKSGAPIQAFTLLVQGQEPQTLSVVDPGGRYRMEGVPAGQLLVSVIAQGHAPVTAKQVSVSAGQTATLDFALGQGGRVTGIVVERGSGKPIAGAEVFVEGLDAVAGVPIRNGTIAGPDGKFALEALEENALAITATAPGHHGRIFSLPRIAEGETAGPVTVELTPLQDGEEPRLELAGIGAVLQKRGDAIWLGQVVAGGGAAEAGLVPGDGIVAIEGAPVGPMSFGEAVQLLRGPEGTSVTLSIVKAPGTGAPMIVSVPRRLVRT
ncbi:MAG TPA: carboxypeptidase regulatory-like domain-containing protein [Myxococcales bacterium]|jgi:uncharacterized GH25 family protein